MYMTNPIDLSKLGVEDIAFLLQFAPRDKLMDAATALRHEVAELERKKKRLALLDTYLEDVEKGEEGREQSDPPAPVVPATPPAISTPESQVTSTPTHADLPNVSFEQKDSKTVSNELDKQRQTSTARAGAQRAVKGALEERNDFIRAQNLAADDWLYRTDYEAAFSEAKWLKSVDNLREVVRQFIRQAREKDVLIEMKVYVLAPTGGIHPTFIYGLPEFQELDNQEKYRQKLKERVKKLGLFMTENEALEAKYARKTGNQMKLEAS